MLLMVMHAGGYFADDPGNDLGMNATALGLGLALRDAVLNLNRDVPGERGALESRA